MRTHPRVLLVAFTLLVVVCLGSGCANLAAIREFASKSTESTQYTKLVSDYIEAPERQKRYQPPNQYPRLDDLSHQRAEQKGRLLLFHDVVSQYMDAVGELAADNAVVYDQEIDELGKAVKSAKGLSQGESDAASGIAKLLLTAAADGWRRHQLRMLIETSNGPFQTVIAALHAVVESGFAADLENERTAIQLHYQGLLAASNDAAGKAALGEWRDLRLSAMDSRRTAIRSFAEILQRIAGGHQKLYENRNDLAKTQLLVDMHRYAMRLQQLFNEVKALEGR